MNSFSSFVHAAELLTRSNTFIKAIRDRGQVKPTVSAQLNRVINRIIQHEKNVAEFENLRAFEADVELGKLYKEAINETLSHNSVDYENLWNVILEDYKNETCIAEIKSGVGGEESSMFVKELGEYFDALSLRFDWNIDECDSSDQQLKLKIDGTGAYSLLLQEAGVHRIQRVPVTDSHGRVHTSTVAVAILPYIAKSLINIDKDDCDIKFMRSSGPGGQNANMSNSAVRITHRTSGISIYCQEYRTAYENLTYGLELLSKKINMLDSQANSNQLNSKRRTQMGNAERSEKIKTYNFIRDDITHHNLNLRFGDISKYFKGAYFNETSLFFRLKQLQACLFKDSES